MIKLETYVDAVPTYYAAVTLTCNFCAENWRTCYSRMTERLHHFCFLQATPFRLRARSPYRRDGQTDRQTDGKIRIAAY